jgi:hypothetical protein
MIGFLQPIARAKVADAGEDNFRHPGLPQPGYLDLMLRLADHRL